jgi:hypothetical protein
MARKITNTRQWPQVWNVSKCQPTWIFAVGCGSHGTTTLELLVGSGARLQPIRWVERFSHDKTLGLFPAVKFGTITCVCIYPCAGTVIASCAISWATSFWVSPQRKSIDNETESMKEEGPNNERARLNNSKWMKLTYPPSKGRQEAWEMYPFFSQVETLLSTAFGHALCYTTSW